LRRDLRNAQWLARQVSETPGWRVLAPVVLQTVCLRHEPPGTVSPEGEVLDGEALDRHTLAWAAAVNESGRAYVTPALLDGRWMVRVSIGAEATERKHVEQLWDLLREMASPRSEPVGPLPGGSDGALNV
jgi:aromatic-L-amino-acid decarboxylase